MSLEVADVCIIPLSQGNLLASSCLSWCTRMFLALIFLTLQQMNTQEAADSISACFTYCVSLGTNHKPEHGRSVMLISICFPCLFQPWWTFLSSQNQRKKRIKKYIITSTLATCGKLPSEIPFLVVGGFVDKHICLLPFSCCLLQCVIIPQWHHSSQAWCHDCSHSNKIESRTRLKSGIKIIWKRYLSILSHKIDGLLRLLFEGWNLF